MPRYCAKKTLIVFWGRGRLVFIPRLQRKLFSRWFSKTCNAFTHILPLSRLHFKVFFKVSLLFGKSDYFSSFYRPAFNFRHFTITLFLGTLKEMNPFKLSVTQSKHHYTVCFVFFAANLRFFSSRLVDRSSP